MWYDGDETDNTEDDTIVYTTAVLSQEQVDAMAQPDPTSAVSRISSPNVSTRHAEPSQTGKPILNNETVLHNDASSVPSTTLHVPSSWGGGERVVARKAPGEPAEPMMIRDLDNDRLTPLEQADQLWRPMLVKNLDSNALIPMSSEDARASGSSGTGAASNAGEIDDPINPSPPSRKLTNCILESAILPPPLLLQSYLLSRASRAKCPSLTLSACKRREAERVSHFDVRWKTGGVQYTGKLEVLPQASSMQEMLMFDDDVNCYGFPRQLGAIRTELAQRSHSDTEGLGRTRGLGAILGFGSSDIRQGTDRLLEVIIPRVDESGRVAQFRTAKGETILTLFKRRRGLQHMFVLHGKLSMAGRNRAAAELYVRSASGEMVLVFHAQRERGKLSEAPVWKMSYAHPLSMFQAFCVLLALQVDEELPSILGAATTAIPTAASVLSQWPLAKEPPASSCSSTPVPPSSPGSSTSERAVEQPAAHGERMTPGTPKELSSIEKPPPSPSRAPQPTEPVMLSPSTPLSPPPPPPPDSDAASPCNEPMATPSPPPSRQVARSPALPLGLAPDAASPSKDGLTKEQELVHTSAPRRSERACDPESLEGTFRNQLRRL